MDGRLELASYNLTTNRYLLDDSPQSRIIVDTIGLLIAELNQMKVEQNTEPQEVGEDYE